MGEGCGEWMGGDGAGYPMRCAACEPGGYQQAESPRPRVKTVAQIRRAQRKRRRRRENQKARKREAKSRAAQEAQTTSG